jgi:hypothetical protein
MSRIFRLVVSAVLLVLALPARAHVHITVDTQAGRIVARAGYYGNESGYAIGTDARFTLDGRWAIPHAADVFPDGPCEGWFGCADLVLTSDYFVSTGRLVGGNFHFEIVSVTPRRGDPVRVVWGSFLDEGPDFTVLAASDGATRLERSFDVQVGGHDHGQACAFSAEGLYDLTMRVWDSHGVYADSDPFTIRFRVGAASACVPADLDCSGSVDAADIGSLLLLFGDCPSGAAGCIGDIDGSGAVDAGDIGSLLIEFGN